MSAAICPYCRGTIELDEPQTVICTGCGTPHHADCFEENGGCTVFGCSAAPAAEPKLSIGAPDLQSFGEASSLPPPPPPSGVAPPPPFIGAMGAPHPSGVAPPPVHSQVAEQLHVPPMFSSLGYGGPRAVPYPTPTPAMLPIRVTDPTTPAKSRTAFMLFGVFLGAFGAHSFYAGFVKKGFLQLAITVLSFGLASLMVWVWAVIDICTINTDKNGIPFRN